MCAKKLVKIEPYEPGKMYEDFKNDINNFSYWFPKIKDCGIPVPKSVWMPVPEDVMKSFFFEKKEEDAKKIREFVEDTVMPAIKDMPVVLFMKNGTFSDKFRFDLCHVTKSVLEISYKLSILSYDSLTLDTWGNAELVFREFLRDEYEAQKKLYTIYSGMPLRPEIRVFYDFSNRRVLYSINYWDWEYCHDTIAMNVTDKIVYETAYPRLQNEFEKNHESVQELVQEKMKDVDMEGIWSVDLMKCQDKWWLIDMATAHTSAYWNPEKIQKA